MNNGHRPVRNPSLVLREEFDDWAILFDPGTGRGFGLNPTGVYIWKLLDGEHTLDEILKVLRRDGQGVREDASTPISAFVGALVAEGLVGFPGSAFSTATSFPSSPGGVERDTKFTYETPQLVYFGGGQRALGDCVSHGSIGGDCLNTGAGATGSCVTVGTCPASLPKFVCCSSGLSAYTNSPPCDGSCGQGSAY